MKSRVAPIKNCQSFETVGWKGLLAAASQTSFKDIDGRSHSPMQSDNRSTNSRCSDERLRSWCWMRGK